MNQRDAKRWVCDRVAATLEADTAFFGDVIYLDESGHSFSRADEDRIRDAVMDLAGELRRRAGLVK